MILRFWRIFSRCPLLYTINIKDFMNYIWNLFNLTRLGVESFEPASLCTFEPCCVYSEQRGSRGAVRPCLPPTRTPCKWFGYNWFPKSCNQTSSSHSTIFNLLRCNNLISDTYPNSNTFFRFTKMSLLRVLHS